MVGKYLLACGELTAPDPSMETVKGEGHRIKQLNRRGRSRKAQKKKHKILNPCQLLLKKKKREPFPEEKIKKKKHVDSKCIQQENEKMCFVVPEKRLSN